MTVAQLELAMDVPEFVKWLGFYRWREGQRERKREMDKAKREVRRGLRGKRGLR